MNAFTRKWQVCNRTSIGGFMEQTWRNMAPSGIDALIQYETRLSDERAGKLREATYWRLRRHWQFINELMLFEIGNKKRHGVSI